MIALFTDRLLLRDHVETDIGTHHELLSDPIVMRYLPDIMTRGMAESMENLRQAMEGIGDPARTRCFLRIEDRATRGHIGEIGYTVTGSTPQGKLAGIGYFLRAAHWGRGYAKEAMRSLIRYAFEEGGVYRVSCGCLKENAASERVMRGVGMIKEAEFLEYQWHEDRLKDRVEYRLLRHEWEQAR